MVDIHTHILPGVDDGAADIYDSIEMASLAHEYGTKVIVATPHCNIPGEYDNYFGDNFSETTMSGHSRRQRRSYSGNSPGLRFWQVWKCLLQRICPAF